MKTFQFQKARAVWAKGRALEKNCELAFRVILPPGDYKLALAASSIYRIWVNGIFAAAGPARAAHGYYRVDEYSMKDFLNKEENVVVIEVVGYNVNTYDTLDQPSFLTAEILLGEKIAAFTGEGGIPVYDLHQREQDAPRYSFQRAFAEAYHLNRENGHFYVGTEENIQQEEIEVQQGKKYICREVRMPLFERLEAEVFPLDSREEGASMYVLPYNATGFFQIEAAAASESRIEVQFDEILVDGKLDYQRTKSVNCFTYQVEPGKYCLTSFAPFTMKYIKIEAEGAVAVNKVRFIEYKHPPVKNKVQTQDEELEVIYQAALESFRACSVDAFMDCPSRERGGWLCDSYFTSSVEHVLTGENVLERVFLENFIVNDSFAYLPEGMLPMCYPADHNNGNFIPNWAMWYVLELEQYRERTGDEELVRQAEKSIDALVNYFSRFENELGLLEDLEGWIFVEWSRANDKDLVSGVNFPTNMLYARMLQAIGKLYHKPELLKKSEQLKEVIRKYSFNGEFYTDHMHRDGTAFINLNVCTEVCQYYAFFTGTADTGRDNALWKVLREEFGPDRALHNAYPEVAFTNAFIGQYLRIELLYRNRCYEEVLQNIKSYFLPMARETGTLWEHKKSTGSCNHGFASYVIYWLAGICGLETGKAGK